MKRTSSVLPAFIKAHLRDLSWQFSSQESPHPEHAACDTSAHVRSVPQAISVIIPTLNEAANMADLLARIHQSLTAASLSYEVIVVDDHSTDETIAVVQAVAKEHALPVRVLTKQGQVGKSYSLLEGFAAATFDVVAMIDGDLQYPPEALPLMAQMLTHSDMVVADRGITYGVADGLRGLMSQAFRTLTKLLFGINTDIQSGLKMFRRTVYEEVTCSPGRWSFDLYLVTHAIFHGYQLTNVPIKFHERQRGASKVAPLKVAIELLFTILKLKVKGRRHMETNMQKDLDKKHSQTSMNLWLKRGLMKREFQVTKSDIPREGDTISRWGILCFIFLLSIVLRISLYKVVNGDYTNYLQPWYDYIQTRGGFAAFKDTFSDYNPPYLYLLALATYLPIQPIIAIKTISVVFDLVMALFTSLILRLKYKQSFVPILGAVAILFAPTVFINGAAWGQCDAIYTSWCLGSLYCLLSKRPIWACVCFGLALSFKLQAMFFLPVLLVLLLTRKLPITSLILIPVTYLALLVPAYLAGRDAQSLLTIYLGQANEHAGALALKAPTVYQWLPANDPENWVQMGMILAMVMVALICFLTLRSRKPITPEIILKLTLVFAVVIPFFMPEMHERYFYLADVVSIVYAFCFPRYWYVAIIEQLCSSMSCIPSLFSEDPTINLAYVAFAVLFLIIVTLADLVKTLYPNIHVLAAMPIAFGNDVSLMTSDTILSPKVSISLDTSKDVSNVVSSEGSNDIISLNEFNNTVSSGVPNNSTSLNDFNDVTPSEVSNTSISFKGFNDAVSSEVINTNTSFKGFNDAVSSEVPNDIPFLVEQKEKEDIPQKSSSIGEQKGAKRRVSGFWLLLLGILLLASALRLYALDVYPENFNQDGMVLGYDAWSLWTTGHDHHGAFFPVFFRSLNDYVPPVANYITAPFVGILGLNEFSTRLPFVLMGIVTVFLVALLGRQWFNSAAGLLAALFLAIDPWHINYSRIALPGSCVPFFTVLGLYCLACSTSLVATKGQKRSTALLWLAGSALSFALLTGSYPTMKLQAPLLLYACAMAVLPFVRNKLSRLGWADFFIWLALYGLFVSPLALAQFRDWNLAQIRFNDISILKQPHWPTVFFTQYANAYNPGVLFFTGFGGGLQVLPQGVGQLFWLEWPLWIFAVIGISQQRYISRQVGFVVPTLLAIWFVTFPIASSLTQGSPHEIRTYNFLPLPEILAGYGAVVAWEMIGRYQWKWFSAARVALAISVCLLVIFNQMFLSFFFSTPLLQTDATADQIPYNVGLRPVLTTVMQQVKPCDTVWLEPDNQTYIYFLFLTRYPSNLFLSTGQEVDAFQNIYGSVGQVHFATPDIEGRRVSLPAGCEGMPSQTFLITRNAQIPPGWQHVMVVSNRAGVPIWQGLVKST